METIDNKDYCDYQTGMLLKEKGYNEWCATSFGTAVRHNGEDIDEDDEWSLKVNGRGDEIEYVPGEWVHEFYNKNENFKKSKTCCSRPHIYDICKWLRENHSLHINVFPVEDRKDDTESGSCDKWSFWTFSISTTMGEYICDDMAQLEHKEYETFEDAMSAGISKCLTEYI